MVPLFAVSRLRDKHPGLGVAYKELLAVKYLLAQSYITSTFKTIHSSTVSHHY